MNGKWINKDTDNLKHDGDNLAIKFSDDEAPDVNKVFSSSMVDTISGAVVAQIPTDYISDEEMTTISGDLVAQIPTDFYTTGEVDSISGALNAKISAVGGADKVEYITISAEDITNKFTDLAEEPIVAGDTLVDVIGGGPQQYGVDFTVVSGVDLNWDGLGLDGIIEENDKIRVTYTYAA